LSNIFSPTVTVQAANIGNTVQVDVYSVPENQWLDTVENHMAGRVSMLTRYKVVGHGALMIRRVMMLGELFHEGAVQPYMDLAITSWNPFIQSTSSYPYGVDKFSLALDSSGLPTDGAGSTATNFPVGGKFDKTNDMTPGYVVLYNSAQISTGSALGIAFGTQGIKARVAQTSTAFGNYYVNPQYFFNQFLTLTTDLKWYQAQSPGAAGITYYQPLAGSIIDQYQLVIPTEGMNAGFKSRLELDTALIPAPNLYCPDALVDGGDLATIVDRLRTNMKRSGSRTQHLRDLVSPYPTVEP